MKNIALSQTHNLGLGRERRRGGKGYGGRGREGQRKGRERRAKREEGKRGDVKERADEVNPRATCRLRP